jgi:tRNA pseudouridine synthase 10
MKLDAKVMEKAIGMLGLGYVCDSCLGRQFAKLIKNKTNKERGRMIRDSLAAEYHARKIRADPMNFLDYDYKESNTEKHLKCVLCENILENLAKISEKPLRELKKMDFRSFMIGVKMSDSLVMNEEKLWEKTGTEYCEPIKSEISREFAKAIIKGLGKKFDPNKPDVIIMFDVQRNEAEIFSNPLFVYGEYKKFVRGLPQTSSPKYKQTVEDIISRPLMRTAKAKGHVLHAQGREDREARCLAWRPFIIELKQPLMRKLSLKEMESAINKSAKVKVARLHLSGRKKVAELKAQNPFKIYRVVVDFEAPVEKPERLRGIVGAIKQRTPNRILGAKPDKTKHKKVKSIKWKRINTKRYQFDITVESGLYLQELITGDGGRTKPSVSQLLENQAHMKEFDLIGIKKG